MEENPVCTRVKSTLFCGGFWQDFGSFFSRILGAARAPLIQSISAGSTAADRASRNGINLPRNSPKKLDFFGSGKE